MKQGCKKFGFYVFLFFVFALSFQSALAAPPEVEIWNNDAPAGWTTTFANGDPVDSVGLPAASSLTPQIAVDYNGVVYAVFVQTNGSENHVYLSRYNGTNVEIWDNGAPGWTTTLANGDPIDLGTASAASVPQLAIDLNNNVYVAFVQGTNIYLSRYDGTSVNIWDSTPGVWTNIFANGTTIDNTAMLFSASPQIAIDSSNNVYVTYTADAAPGGHVHIFLSRYNGTDVRIWDNGITNWTTTFTNGDPIDTGITTGAGSSKIAVDSTGKVYVAFVKYNAGSIMHLYLSRYNGTNAEIWNNDAPAGWTTTFANGDPIDTGTASNINGNGYDLAVDSTGKVYVAFAQYNGAQPYIYLSRYNGTNVEIWDNGTPGWITTFGAGDPIDTGLAEYAATPQVAIDSTNNVYVTYVKGAGAIDNIFISRYNGTDAEIWDNGITNWTTTFTNGDPIASAVASAASVPQIGVDSSGIVYVTFAQAGHIYLSRYNGTRAEIWDNTTSAWITTFANGDPIDLGTANAASAPQLVVSTTTGNVYMDYVQSNGVRNHVYLSRYNVVVPPVIVLPTITVSAATSITTTLATLNGNITNTGGENNTIRGFEYGLTTAYGTATSTTDSYGTGAYSFAVTGLDPSTTYHFRAFSTNSAGTSSSTDLTFVTDALPPVIVLPTITVSAASSITTTLATLNGNITDTGGENNTIRGFEYGLTTAYGTATSTTDSYGTGAYSFAVTGLDPSTTYHFRAFSTNSAGTSSSTDLTFVTDALPPVIVLPTITVSAASSITTTLATLNGNITDTGGENNTIRGFEYGLTTAYGTATSTTDSYGTGAYSFAVTGLDPSTTYHFRAFSTNSAGTSSSTDLTFVTNSSGGGGGGHTNTPPVVTVPPIVLPPLVTTPPVVVSPPVTPAPVTPESPTLPTPTESPVISPSDNQTDSSLSEIVEVNALVDAINSGTKKLFTGAKLIFESQTGGTVTKVVATVGVLSGGLAATSLIDLASMPFRLWGLLLSIFGLKKRNRPWGTVYDSVTKQPIDPAYVTLKNISTGEENTSITDLDGRYGFLVTPGKYILSASKTNYTFPSQKMQGQMEDAMYNNLYFGEELLLEGDSLLINKNIPIDPIKFDWNEFVKGKKKLMKFYSKRERVIRLITDWTFRVGFVVSVASIFLVPAPYNLIIFGLYLLLAIVRKFGLKFKALGTLLEKDGSPLSFAIIRVFDAELKVQITNKVADKIGRYYCLVPKGKYFVKIEKKNDDESYSEIFTSEPFDASNGIIRKSFTV